MKKNLSFFLIVIFAVLVSCNTAPPESVVLSELQELIGTNVELETTVGLEVTGSKKAPTITNQFNPSIGSQVIYEVLGITPKGKAFKAVLLGNERVNFKNFKGQVQMRSRMARVQNQVVLTGTIFAPEVSSQPIAFIAAGQNAVFTGPPVGSVHEIMGSANLKGRCGTTGMGGSFGFEQTNKTIRGSLFGLPANQTLNCFLPEINDEVLVSFRSTAVQTHLGIILSLHGSLVSNTATSIVGQAANNTGLPSGGMGVSDAPLDPATSQITLEAKSNVRELGPDSSGELLSFDNRTGTLVFRSLRGNLVGLSVGNIIVSAPLTLTPDGFMRRVTNIQSSNSEVTVQTERSVLGDLVEEADIRIEETVDLLEIQRARALERGEVIYAASQIKTQNLRPQNLLPRIDESFNWVIFDQDGNTTTTNDQVVVKGHFKVEPKIIVKLKCSGFLCTKPDFTAKFVMDEEAKIEVKANLKKELNKSKQLLRIPLGAITVGFLVFIPEIVVDVSLEGLIRVEVNYSATQSINYEVGVQYNSSTKWTKINKFNKTFTSNSPTFEAEIEAKAKLTASARLMLYGIAGVEADVGVYAKFEGQYPGSPAWKISGGIEGNIGVDLDLIVWQEELNVPIFNKTWAISEAPNTPPDWEKLEPKTICLDGTTPNTITQAGNSVVKFRAVVDDAENGKGQVTIFWSSNRSGELGTTQPGSPHSPGYALPSGAHTITAIAEDSNGRRATRIININASGNAHCTLGVPLIGVDIQTQNNATPIMNASRTMTFTAHTAGGLNTCCLITWSSDLEGVLGTSNGTNQPDLSRDHSFTHTFQFQTPQTITASISQNGNASAESLAIGALPILTSNPILSNIQANTPSGTRYVYLGDTVSFESTSNAITPTWNSSVESDSINEKTGSNVNTKFNSTGPRTITATSQNNTGGFSSQTYRINVLNPLAKP